MKPLLVGQAPGPNTDPALPLYPLPKSSAGGRLAKFMGLSRTQYLRTFDRVNLLHSFPGKTGRDDKFPITKARVAADAMKPLMNNRTVILVGRNVSNAFGYGASEVPFFSWSREDQYGYDFAVIPHPSGRSRWYNSEENLAMASQFWSAFLAESEQNVVAFPGNRAHYALK